MRLTTSILPTLSLLLLQTTRAIDLDIDSFPSIKEAAAQVAKDLAGEFWDPTSYSGVPNGVGQYAWWQHGAILGAYVDYWHLTGDDTYNSNVTVGWLKGVSPSLDLLPKEHAFDIGNDDQGFWSIMSMDAVERVFPETDEQKKMGAGFLEITHYADAAEMSYKWMRESNLIQDDYWINDGLDVNECTKLTTKRWTYNYGTIMAGCAAMYNFTTGSKRAYWKQELDNILNSTYATFIDAETGALKEIQCQESKTCDMDQRSFKAYLVRWMGYTAQVAPYTYDTIMMHLRKNAALAAATCIGEPHGTACGQKWNIGAQWDGYHGLGEQINAMEVIQNIIPYVRPNIGLIFNSNNGGTSRSNPGGKGNKKTMRNWRLILAAEYAKYALRNYEIKAADRFGGAVLTLLTLGLLAGMVVFVVSEPDVEEKSEEKSEERPRPRSVVE
ncbi:hydrolase 76 protein [Orbilia oligospora]|uniref:Mannan endo-1,6-alpha-mannosidase n=1 Tax=Orbilia oligospora TaxID=2813651 RepID=A0A8H8V815_ORBOL|nr:hydrolase 76 protein [Orbilia oligospora]